MLTTGPRDAGRPEYRARRYDGVQLLRFVAALLVVLTHVPTYLHDRLGSPQIEPWTGQVGVAVFFAISGFVAVLVTNRTPRPTAGAFLRRRLIRVLPLAWLVMTVKLVTTLVAPDAVQRAADSPTYIALSYLFLPATGPDGAVTPFYIVTWTIAFEMLFYLVVTAALLLRIDVLRTVAVVFVALAVGSAARGDSWPAWQFHANRVVLCFLVGMVIAHWAADRRTVLAVVRLSAIGTLWTAVAVLAGAGPVEVAMLPVAAVVLAVTVAAESRVGPVVGPRTRVLGDASYALYLTHPIVAPATVAVVATVVSGPLAPVVAGTLAVMAAVVVSVVVWFAVDRPTIRLLQGGRRTDRGRRRAGHRQAAE